MFFWMPSQFVLFNGKSWRQMEAISNKRPARMINFLEWEAAVNSCSVWVRGWYEYEIDLKERLAWTRDFVSIWGNIIMFTIHCFFLIISSINSSIQFLILGPDEKQSNVEQQNSYFVAFIIVVVMVLIIVAFCGIAYAKRDKIRAYYAEIQIKRGTKKAE